MESGTSLERMVFFSDADFAIALTLLALDLKPPPEGVAAAQRDGALIDAISELFAYALSLMIIASRGCPNIRISRFSAISIRRWPG
ncbi:TMEM175 family protein [Arthrobacter humicola]